MPFTLSATGLEIETIDEILADIEADEYAGIATTLNLQAPDPIAVMNGVIAERLNAVEELVGALYSGMQPDNATGDQLEGLALITGTTRQPATKTLVACTITTDAAFGPQASGTMFASVSGVPDVLYTNVDEFSAAGAMATTGVDFECVDTGENAVNASTLTVIATALTHWTAITNPAAGVTGREIQNDASLRASRQAELALGGATNAAAIAADILQFLQPSQSPLSIPGILVGTGAANSPFTLAASTRSVTVLWNDTDVPDANGLPGHSIEAIVYAPSASTGDENALAALLLMDKAAGIATYTGSGVPRSKVITDTQGVSETIYYTYPDLLNTNIAVTVKARPGTTITAAEVKDAIFAYANGTNSSGVPLDGYTANWVPGGTVYQSSIVGAIFAFDIPEVADVTAVTLSSANVGNDIVPTIRQLVAIPSAAAITVTIA